MLPYNPLHTKEPTLEEGETGGTKDWGTLPVPNTHPVNNNKRLGSISIWENHWKAFKFQDQSSKY